jgi:hypothetical protein
MVALVSVALVLALSGGKDHKQLTNRSAPIFVDSAMISIPKFLMGASINAGQGSKKGGARKSARPKRFHPPPNPRVPAFVQGLRNALHNGSEVFLLISAIITTRHQSLVYDDKLDLITRLLSYRCAFDNPPTHL